MRIFLSTKTVFCIVVFLFSQVTHANDWSQSTRIVHTDVDFYNDELERPTTVRFWHLASNESCEAQICFAATQEQDKTRVAVISHGAFGSPLGMSWLAEPLAAAGWLVAGVAHYGESSMYGQDTVDYSVVGRFWRRPQDISFVIDQLDNEGLLNIEVDTKSLVMLGHSSGGFTALALAGARLADGKTLAYCQSEKAKLDRGCSYVSIPQLKRMQQSAADIGALQDTMADRRISRLVALDPALGHAVDVRSLSDISVPTLILGSVENDFLPFEVHAANYAKHIPGSQLVPVGQGAGHFVYINRCDFDWKAAGVPICEDREGVDRQAIQQQLIPQILTFLNEDN